MQQDIAGGSMQNQGITLLLGGDGYILIGRHDDRFGGLYLYRLTGFHHHGAERAVYSDDFQHYFHRVLRTASRRRISSHCPP